MMSGSGGNSTIVPDYDIIFRSDARQLTQVRAGLRGWLAARHLRSSQIEDTLLACGEACSNAIEHAYAGAAGEIRLTACHDERRRLLILIVEDHGRWRERPAPGARGRGLAIIGRMMSSVDLMRGRNGTRLVMTYDLARR